MWQREYIIDPQQIDTKAINENVTAFTEMYSLRSFADLIYRTKYVDRPCYNVNVFMFIDWGSIAVGWFGEPNP